MYNILVGCWQTGVLYDRERLLQRVGRFYGSDTQGDVDGMRKLSDLFPYPFITVEMTILPRQARDKHSENSKRTTRFLRRNAVGVWRGCGKSLFYAIVLLKTIDLPRQARDNHRKS